MQASPTRRVNSLAGCSGWCYGLRTSKALSRYPDAGWSNARLAGWGASADWRAIMNTWSSPVRPWSTSPLLAACSNMPPNLFEKHSLSYRLAWLFCCYHFCRPHMSLANTVLNGQLYKRCTPAIKAGLTDRLWSTQDVLFWRPSPVAT